MSYIDIAIIAIVVLFGLLGLKTGFIKSIIGFFGTIVSLIAALFLTGIAAEYLLRHVPFFTNLVLGTGKGSLNGLLYSMMPAALKALPAGATGAEIAGALGGNFFSQMLGQFIRLLGTTGSDELSVAQMASLLLAGHIFTLLVASTLFFLIRLVVWIISMVANAILKDKKVSALNRFFGFLLGLLKGSFFVVLIFAVMSFMITMPLLDPVNRELDEKTVIGKPVAAFVFKSVDKYINHGDALDSLLFIIGKQGYKATAAENAADSALRGALSEGDIFGIQYDPDLKAYIRQLITYNGAAAKKIKGGGVGAANQDALTDFTASLKSGDIKALYDELKIYIAEYIAGEGQMSDIIYAVEAIADEYTVLEDLTGLSIVIEPYTHQT